MNDGTSQPKDDSELAAALRTLVLTAYADGESVEGTWTIQSIPEEIPDWSVTIARTDVPEADIDVQVDR